MEFLTLGIHELLAEKLAKAGINEPSEVQKQALPELLAGKDGVIVSPTGTGKTLAYLLPALQRIDAARKETQALILAPTQELAMQIMREAETYGQPLGVKAVALIGGASLARQLERMKSKPALIVGTPGRVREVANTRKLSLHAVTYVVIDETDRVFSLGGKSDVEFLMARTSRERQTVFVSATRSQAMKEAERKWQNDPWVSDVSEAENDNGLSKTLKHWYFLTDRREKIDLIRRLVLHMKPSSALLFVNDTEKIGELLAKLRYEGLSVDALYGDTRGQERGETMQRFRSGRTKLLIATDVAARGLDLPGLTLVIQYEPALDADHYVHRSGRTARMGREGTSITLIAPEERFIVDKLEKQLGITIEPRTTYEGKVVTLEESDARRSRTAAGKPKFEWKSKTEYLKSQEQKEAQPQRKPDTEAAGSRAAAKPSDIARVSKQPAKSDAASTSKPNSKPDAARAAAELRSGAGVKTSAAQRSGKPSARKPAQADLANKRDDASTKQEPSAKAVVKASAAKPGKSKSERERERKNKGAPKWLKEKREAAKPEDNDNKS
ncbi:DEAD/DEAH box helicase [Cohnella soli]|uniref:DEAD/DEAH box helicase n=1 Tax=Cohnella soli TaxID=425005 RepID=A0ABW0HWE1_9BACL